LDTENRHTYEWHRRQEKTQVTSVRNHSLTRSPTNPGAQDLQKLLAARGNPQHFEELTEPYRRELQVHCYRILGSLQEAEDMVQETMLKAWKRLETFEGRSSLRAWLYKIATNTCLDFIDQKRTRRLLPLEVFPAADPNAQILPPVPEVTWLEPYPDEWLDDRSALDPEARYTNRESISLAFLTALQVLPPRQRAVLILCDVLDFAAREAAEVLEMSVSAISSILHRARKTLSQRYQGKAGDISAGPTDERSQWLLNHFVEAWESADVNGLVALLKEDAVLAMPPSPSWYKGRANIGVFVAATVFADSGMFHGKASGRWRLLGSRANGAPAFAIYERTDADGYQSFGMHVLEHDSEGFSQIISFIDPSLPTRFGLPASLDKQ
jgi:RNA polymerase sigma-70 factor (ECF subfamily)